MVVFIVSCFEKIMEPLATTRQSLTWLCMCPADESSSRWQKIAYTAFTTIGVVVTGVGIVGGLTFCAKFVSIDLGKSMFAFLYVAAEFTVIYTALVVLLLMRHKIGSILKALTTIYKDAGEYSSLEKVQRKWKK